VLKLESEVAIDDKRVIHEQVVDEFGPMTSELEIQVQETETTQLGRNLQSRDVHTLDWRCPHPGLEMSTPWI
ncbi:hypothetical protein WICPIJ_000917, partial [Wickerhamomyces pijperi]